MVINGDSIMSKVLVLEDNLLNAKVLTAMLHKLGICEILHVDTIASAKRLLPRVASEEFDVVISDLMLPDGLAFDFISDVVACNSTPVTAYSALSESDCMAELKSRGCSSLLSKPLSFNALQAYIAGVIIH